MPPREDTNPGWSDKYDDYDKAIIPVEDFPHGLFVEMRLTGDDPDVPVVTLVNAHTQRN